MAVDTSVPKGADKTAPELLHAFLKREDVPAELIQVGRNKWAVWGRVEAQKAQGRPIVLISHIDTRTIEKEAWPLGTRPLTLTEKEDRLWGAGVRGGKALAVLHATSLAILASLKGPTARDVHMVALPDGLTLNARSLDRVIEAVPSIATATIALAGGGLDIRDWFGDGRKVQAIAVGERGAAIVQVAATRRGGEDLSSSERLARALVAIDQRPRQPRLTATNRALVRASASRMSAPRRWLRNSSLGVKLFVVPEFIDRPGLRGQFVDTVRTVQLEAGRRRGTDAPYRSRAFLRAELLEDQSPGGLAQSLRRSIADGNVHVTVRTASPLSMTGVRDDWMKKIRRASATSKETLTVPILTGPTGTDPLRSVGVPVFGYAPMTVTAAEVDFDGPQNISQNDFRASVRRMVGLVVNLSAQ